MLGLETVLLNVVAPALLPALTDGIRGLLAKVTGSEGAKPQTVDEAIRLMEADNRRLELLGKLEGEGETYRWVEAIRKLQRPIVGFLVTLAYVLAVSGVVADDFKADLAAQIASSYIFYLFGERAYMHMTRKARASFPAR